MWTPERTRQHSLAMKRAWRRKQREGTAKRTTNGHANAQTTEVYDFVPDLRQDVVKTPAAPVTVEGGRFPFQQYRTITDELHGIIAHRDEDGRNSYLEFWDGFPHGLSDLTFEMHRRVARVLGVEKELAAGATGVRQQELLKVMRSDMQDLANYAIFGVMRLDKDSHDLA